MSLYSTFLSVFVLYYPANNLLLASMVAVLLPLALVRSLDVVLIIGKMMNVKDFSDYGYEGNTESEIQRLRAAEKTKQEVIEFIVKSKKEGGRRGSVVFASAYRKGPRAPPKRPQPPPSSANDGNNNTNNLAGKLDAFGAAIFPFSFIQGRGVELTTVERRNTDGDDAVKRIQSSARGTAFPFSFGFQTSKRSSSKDRKDSLVVSDRERASSVGLDAIYGRSSQVGDAEMRGDAEMGGRGGSGLTLSQKLAGASAHFLINRGVLFQPGQGPRRLDIAAGGGGDVSERESYKVAHAWTEEVDEETGEIYFYNTLTDESSWLKPPAYVPSKTSTTVRKSPWSEQIDEETGDKYWYNEDTDENTWEMPRELAIAANTRKMSIVPANTRKMSIIPFSVPKSQVEPPKATVSPWSEVVDEETGDIYYYNEEADESSWEVPPDFSASKGKDPQSGWTEQVDPSSGNSYWFNAETGESSWDNPSGGKSSQSGWTEQVDPSSGNTYWFDAATGESSWDNPAGKKDSQSGWTEQIDPATNNTYWYNAQTGESSWDNPARVVSGAKKVKDLFATISSNLKSQPKRTSTVAVAGFQEWTEEKDESGDIYYYNSVTDESRWDPPDGFLQSKAAASKAAKNKGAAGRHGFNRSAWK